MRRPWMKFWVGDYLRDTQALTAEEHGAYMLILMQLWTDAGRIAQRDAQRVARVPLERWPAVWEQIAKYFEVSADGTTVSQRRLTQELENATKEHEDRARGAEVTNKRKRSKHAERSAERHAGRLAERSADRDAQGSVHQKPEARSQTASTCVEVTAEVREKLQAVHAEWIVRKGPKDRESFEALIDQWTKTPAPIDRFVEAALWRLQRYDADDTQHFPSLRNFLSKGMWQTEVGPKREKPTKQQPQRPEVELPPEAEV